MKKRVLFGIGVLAASSFFVSCSDELGGISNGNGSISLAVDMNTEVITSRSTDPASKAAASRAEEITAADLSIRLTKSDGTGSWEWPTVADFPTEKEFGVGEYTIEAYYGDVNEQGFDCPSYLGSQVINVKDGETTPVSLTATMSKSMVTIKYTDAFVGYMADYGAKVNGIEYTKDETRAVYVTPGDVEIKVSVTKPNGLGAEFTLDKVTAEAKHHYTVTLDVNNGNVGDVQLTVEFDDNMDEEEVEIDLSDKLLSTPEPVINAEGFTPETPVEVVAGLPVENSLSMSLIALAGLKEVNLTTESESLIAQGWPADINLMAADGATQQTLVNMGLDVLGLWNKPGEMAVIDFKNVVKSLKTVQGGDNTTTFTVTVKDKIMRESDPMTLSIVAEDVNIELAGTGQFYEPGAPLNLKVGFNGGDAALKDNLVIEYKNIVANVWRKLEIVNISEGVSRAMSDYTVTVNTPEQDVELVVRAKVGNNISNELTVDMAPFEIELNSLNIFASHIYVNVIGTQGNAAPSTTNLTFIAQKNGEGEFVEVAHTMVDGYAKITGFDGDSDYRLKVRIDGVGSKPVSFRTEAATQLENGNLDAWSYQQGASSHWGIYSLTGWATLNELTTSEGSDYGLLGRGGAGYVAKSGTQETDDAKSGSAALIQTVGWGSNNSSGYTLGPSVRCDNVTPGELYIGSYDSASKSGNYGISFASRPSSLTFSYKYIAVNPADYGTAEIIVLADDNSEIAKQTFQISATESYTEKTLSLDYPLSSKKAAKLVVKFKSSDNPDCLVVNTTNLTYPSRSRQTDTGFVGSKLYVDDIQLIY